MCVVSNGVTDESSSSADKLATISNPTELSEKKF